MQNVRNVSSQENTWPWQRLSNAELLFFVLLFFQFKLHKVAKSTRLEKQTVKDLK